MMKILKEKNFDISKITRFSAIDGRTHDFSQDLRLFVNIDLSIIKNPYKSHEFRKGVLGCALSHYKIWKIINCDSNNNNDIFIPSVMSVDFYIKNRINKNKTELFTEEVKSSFSKQNSKNSLSNKSISLINSNIGNTNISIDLKGSIEIQGSLEFKDQQGGSLTQQGENWNLDINQKQLDKP